MLDTDTKRRIDTARDILVGKVPELPAPEPGRGEVLFRMEAASVNPVDFKTRNGMLRALQSYRMPAILGNDAAGVVTALGPGVDGFRVGERVAARLDKARMGGFAELVVARPQHLARIPEGVSFAQAAALALALAGLTAWQCLSEVLRVGRGERVLIHAGGGARRGWPTATGSCARMAPAWPCCWKCWRAANCGCGSNGNFRSCRRPRRCGSPRRAGCTASW